MTMQHVARSFKVSLHISHPEIDPAEISHSSGLTPSRSTQAGMARMTPAGDPLGGTYGVSHWMHEFDVQGASELVEVLEQLVEDLQRNEVLFHRIARDGGTVQLFCGVFAAGNWDEVLPHLLLGRLAALEIDLRLDVYPRDDGIHSDNY